MLWFRFRCSYLGGGCEAAVFFQGHACIFRAGFPKGFSFCGNFCRFVDHLKCLEVNLLPGHILGFYVISSKWVEDPGDHGVVWVPLSRLSFCEGPRFCVVITVTVMRGWTRRQGLRDCLLRWLAFIREPVGIQVLVGMR